MGVSWLLFVDDFNSIQRDRNRVLQGLAEQLGHLGPADRMAVVAWDGKRLNMLASWTGSTRELQRALDAAMKQKAHGLERLAEQRQLDVERNPEGRFPRTVMSQADPTRLDPDERQLVDMLESQVSRSIRAAASALRAFAAPPGRKAMVMLSGGMPWRPVDYVVTLPGRMVTEPTVGGEDLYRPLADVANLLGYTIYTVDVPGQSQHLFDAADARPRLGGAMAESNREQQLHQSLEWLAKDTGGRAFLNDKRLAVFEEAVTDTRSFYWLGYTPKRSGDDQLHRVEVTVKRPGLEARARSGFRDVSKRAEVSMAVESALLFGNPASAAPLAIAIGRPEKSGRGMKVPLTLTIPLAELTPLPVADGRVAELELRVAAQDIDNGSLAAIPVVPLQLRVPANVAPGASAHYETTLALRRAAHDLVVVLYEPVSGKLFSATARVSP